MSEIIAVDADDTLFDENNAVRLYMNETYGFQHTVDDYMAAGPYDNFWEKIWNRSPEETQEMFESFVRSTYNENLQPVEGAVPVLKELKDKYELVIVTSRDQRNIEMTHASLALHYPAIFAEVHFVPLWGNGEKVTKAKICNEIGASYLIDDNFDHCKLAAEAGVTAILFGDYGWNREQELLDGMVRCNDWDAVRNVLQP